MDVINDLPIECTIIIKDTITLSFIVTEYHFEIYHGNSCYQAVILKPKEVFHINLIELLTNYLNVLKLECEIKITNQKQTNIKTMSECDFDSSLKKGYFSFNNKWKKNYFYF